MNTLVIGGNSGLGLELGKLLVKKGGHVYVTGRTLRAIPKELVFIELDVGENIEQLKSDLDKLIARIPKIDLFIYAAGFYENGHLSELPDGHIVRTINVGLVAPTLALKRILERQGHLDGFIAITSTSQWIPRELEPTYAGVKAGLAMLANSASLDPKINKTLVVGPAGMNTNFWSEVGRHTNNLLAPNWVAQQILLLWNEDYSYRLARILRGPVAESERVKTIETRFE